MTTKTKANGKISAPEVVEEAVKKTAAKKTPAKKVEVVSAMNFTIPRPDWRTVTIPIKGLDGVSLITHAWDEKCRKQMLDKHMGKPVPKKEPKDPVREYEASMYRTADGAHGIPAGAFKDAMVQACRFVDGLTMTFAKLLFFVRFDAVSTQGMRLVTIQGKPHMRQDMVRLHGKTPDIRFRAEYPSWRATLKINYNGGVITANQLINLCALAGVHVGVGEMRPSSPDSTTGDCGLWEILTNDE